MKNIRHFEVIIVGGSYAGLSAAMALGRSLRKVLIIDSGKACNRQTPHSHNFITQDGVAPAEISEKAKAQVLQYDTVEFLSDWVQGVMKVDQSFEIKTKNDFTFTADKVLFTTGVTDVMPEIPGFSECWGISVLHCPYCHGYEVKHENIGILANGEVAFELCQLIQHWTNQLSLFTNGPATLTAEQKAFIAQLNIEIIEKEIAELKHSAAYLEGVAFKDGTQCDLTAIFASVETTQHCHLPAQLGCELNEQGYIEVDFFQKTSVNGIFAAGDNTTPLRTVSIAVAAGTKAGVSINKELIGEQFSKRAN